MTTLHEAWRLLLEAGRGHTGGLAPEAPASEAEIAEAERRLKRPLPAPLATMVRLSRRWSWYQPDYCDEVFFLTPAEIVRESRRPANPDEVLDVDDAGPGVREKVYGPGRTTFAVTDYLRFQLDEDPAPGGRVGQVLRVDFEEGRIDVVAPSFEAFLVDGLRALQRQLADAAPDPGAIAGVVVPEPPLPPAPVAAPPRPPAKPSKRYLAAVGDDALTAAAKALGAAIEQASPELARRLRKGVTPAQARAALRAEQNEGEMTDRLLPLYAVIDGQAGRKPLLPCPVGRSPGLALLSVTEAASCHSNETGRAFLFKDRRVPADPGIRATHWHRRWFPIARTALDDATFTYTLFVDFAPADGGVEGQLVLDCSRHRDGVEVEASRQRIAPSLPAWLQGLADELTHGRLRATEQGLRPAETP